MENPEINSNLNIFPTYEDHRGRLTFIENYNHIPFSINRILCVYKPLNFNMAVFGREEIIIAISGSLKLEVKSTTDNYSVELNRANIGALVSNFSFIKISEASENAICLVLSSAEENKPIGTDRLDTFKRMLLEHSLPIEKTMKTQFEHKTKLNISFQQSTVNDCILYNLSSCCPNSNMFEFGEKFNIPFNIKRVFYIYDIPQKCDRGDHCHKDDYQLLVVLNGSLDIELSDGTNTKELHLDRPNQAIFIINGIWLKMKNFSTSTICLVASSNNFNNDDYIDNYEEFLQLKENAGNSI